MTGPIPSVDAIPCRNDETGLVNSMNAVLSCDMIQSFENTATEDIFNGLDSRSARNACPRSLWPIAVRKLDQLDSAKSLGDLRIPPGNRLEPLAGARKG